MASTNPPLDIAGLRERLELFLAMPGDMEHPAGYPRLLSINRDEARAIFAALSTSAEPVVAAARAMFADDINMNEYHQCRMALRDAIRELDAKERKP